jgi:hypothetical protein
MYQQNRPQMPMPGMMKGVSPLSGLTDGDEIMAEEQRMGRQPASQAEQMLQQSSPAIDPYQMEVFKSIFDADTRTRLKEGVMDMQDSFEQEKRDEGTSKQGFEQRFPRGFLGAPQYRRTR